MKLFLYVICLACVTCSVSATNIFDDADVESFLPFLKNIKKPPACPLNEIYKTCTGKCSDCTQRGMCTITKCIEGCDCIPRFFRLTPDGPCEPVANCPKPECGENEIFRECGPICERCTTLPCRVLNCDYKCYCKEGYLRNEEGKCIPKDECPKRERCTFNEVWAENGPVEEFCLNGRNETVSSEIQNVAKCYCKEGHKRNGLGHCVTETICPLIRCIGVEVYHNCIPKCNTTCRNYGNPDCTEDGNCYSGCFCPPGYVMNDFRSCIPVEDCSLVDEQVKIIGYETTESELAKSTVTSLSDDSEDIVDAIKNPSTDEAAGEWTTTTVDLDYDLSMTTASQIMSAATEETITESTKNNEDEIPKDEEEDDDEDI